MPKIDVNAESFYRLLGSRPSLVELEEMLTVAKAELDGVDDAAGLLRIELNDTNRPDLWSTAGLARQLRVYQDATPPAYKFLHQKAAGHDHRRIVVDPKLEKIRPFITAFAVEGPPVDDALLVDLIQTQEKLCWNFGRRRRSIAMGVYRTDLIKWPIHYVAADPTATGFVPLGETREFNLRQIIAEHPKGREFGHIVEGFDRFPFLRDADGGVLSFPPVINSARIGAVEVGDSRLFVEMTGTDLPSLLLAANIVACDLSDQGFTVLPVCVEYPYPTHLGREIVTPLYFQSKVEVETSYAAKILGEIFSPQEAATYLSRMGVKAEVSGTTLVVRPPEYRNDFLHPVDVVEDIMIGRGMSRFEPVMPQDFTVGRVSDAETYARRVKSLMVGLGFQEMIFNYLGSRKDFAERMHVADDGMIRISNPMSENYQYVRPSILPQLLLAEAVSGNAAYPHHIFEIGKTAGLDPAEDSGTRTDDKLGFVSAAPEAGYNLVNAQIGALLFFLGFQWTLEELDDPRFISGRSAGLLVGGVKAGVFGEVHPAILEGWGISMPVTAAEVDLGILSRKRGIER